MKKILSILLVLLIAGGCNSVEEEQEEVTVEEKTEGQIFKEEYESLNGLQDIKYPDEVYRTVEIDEENPYISITLPEIIEKINDEETFYVYFGDPKCPWCRSNIESAVATAKEKGIESIYYINFWDENRNEIVRDKYEVVDNQLELTIEASDEYYELLDILDSYLNEYIVQDNNGNSYDTNEKRIVIPAYVHFTDGVVDKYTEATAIDQSDSHGELNETIIDEQESDFSTFFNQSKACSLNSKGC